MEELYKTIEEKIKASGYPRKISGEDVYDDICESDRWEREWKLCAAFQI